MEGKGDSKKVNHILAYPSRTRLLIALCLGFPICKMALRPLGSFFWVLFVCLVQTAEIDLICFGERNYINIGVACVSFGLSKHKIGQTYEGDFVI